jgi:DNA-binding MarR family transcriptional regulator
VPDAETLPQPNWPISGSPPLDRVVEAVFHVVKAFKFKDGPDGASGMGRAQFTTLMALRRRSPRRLTSLAEEGRCDLSVLSRQIGALESSGLVERIRDPEDGRAFLVSLTERGSQTLDQIWSSRLANLRGHLADFEDADLDMAALILDRIAHAWGRPEPGSERQHGASPKAGPSPQD